MFTKRVSARAGAVSLAAVVALGSAVGVAGAEAAKPNPRPKVAMVIGLTANPFMKTVSDGAKDGTKAVSGASLKYVGPPAPNPTTEIQLLQNVLSTKPAGVAVMPLQASVWNRALSDAGKTGIPLLAFNEAPKQPSPVKTFVGINDRQAAYSLLLELRKKVGANARGSIVLGNCIPGVATLDFRITAFKQGIAKYLPNAKVVGPIETTTEPTKNLAAWQGAMGANRDALAFIGNCDSDGPGLVKAKKESGVKGELLTFDINLESVRGIKDGTMLAALGEAPYVRGYISARLLAETAKKGTTLPKGFVNIKGELVTKSNASRVLTRESSLANTRKAYKQYLTTFFKNPAAQMEPLSNVYK